MKIVRTQRALKGYNDVAQYIADNFGEKALSDFKKRVKEYTKLLKIMPYLGAVDEEISTDKFEYRTVTVYRRSIMSYRVEGEIIYIVDFWDVRANR